MGVCLDRRFGVVLLLFPGVSSQRNLSEMFYGFIGNFEKAVDASRFDLLFISSLGSRNILKFFCNKCRIGESLVK